MCEMQLRPSGADSPYVPTKYSIISINVSISADCFDLFSIICVYLYIFNFVFICLKNTRFFYGSSFIQTTVEIKLNFKYSRKIIRQACNSKIDLT